MQDPQRDLQVMGVVLLPPHIAEGLLHPRAQHGSAERVWQERGPTFLSLICL